LKKTLLIIFICFIALLGHHSEVRAQGKQRVIQFSGLVVNGDKDYGVPGVNLYIPSAGRGTSSNHLGYFSMPVLAGDSVIISAISFKKQYYIVPDDDRQSISVIIYLKEDTTMLPLVEILPYPTEELFKEAFLSLELPETEMEYMRKNLDEKVMARLRDEMPMSSSANHNHYVNQQFNSMHNRRFQPTLQLLNPFAWAQFIQSVKRGDLKKKDWQQDED
jgi:hypothetical protein